MIALDPKKILSMVQLQKLSSKKLAKYGTPLFVMDLKSKRKVFVILEADAYEKMILLGKSGARAGGNLEKTVNIPDYRKMGLLWDHPKMTNKEFHKFIKSPENPNNVWAVRRLMEYAPSSVVTKVLSLGELVKITEQISLRPLFKEAWSRAIQYWAQNP